jgi:hypothetical protein
MSRPAPLTVNVPDEALALPVTDGDPISRVAHGDGSDCAAAGITPAAKRHTPTSQGRAPPRKSFLFTFITSVLELPLSTALLMDR